MFRSTSRDSIVNPLFKRELVKSESSTNIKFVNVKFFTLRDFKLEKKIDDRAPVSKTSPLPPLFSDLSPASASRVAQAAPRSLRPVRLGPLVRKPLGSAGRTP
ncbi:PREDICTED: uncharacterized protein LOC105570072 [Vollenhovia emeryi]|uniref:uncharacterized protein LOC105570072 n=1 Tax=Vollenhovia emeryi TaxID=411798 RepID=UPI0005F571F3|nr:PREDICTED: uncharacterized protein LOC105570072 [Vollenhovia emeryi]